MRNWAAVLGIVGGGASALYWGLVPFTSNVTYTHPANWGFYLVFFLLSLVGLAGAWMSGVSNRVAPVMMAIGVIAGTGALFLPGLLLAVGALLAVGPIGEQPKLAA